MRSWISQKWVGEWGVYFRFLSTLVICVAGVFTYFSITGCGEGGGGGCGNQGPVGLYSSDYTAANNTISSPPYNFSVSGTSFNTLTAEPGLQSSAVLPGSVVTRYINYSTETGKDPTQIEWTPPMGASNFNFYSTPPTNPSGPAPFIYNNNPPLNMPLQISYNAPALPTYKSSLVVGEMIKASRTGYTDDIHVVNYTISTTATRAQAVLLPAINLQQNEKIPAANVPALKVRRWYGMKGTTLTTTLCQELYDWLQSDSTFTAMRMPVATGGVSNPSYELPVLFPIDSNASANLIDNRPKININGYSLPALGIPDLPLEVRSDRIAFMENYLPSAAGEHWVALGVAKQPKITCPTGINKTSWEFYIEFSANPATPIAALPLYYCQDGQNAPPIGNLALNLLAGQKDGKAAPSAQIEGITCLGPQEHILNPTPVIYVGNPNTLWNVYPPEEIRLKHSVQVIGYAPTINFMINSDIAGVNWKIYEGDDIAPNLSKEVNISQPYTALPTMMFFWLIGNVPTGTSPGAHNVSLQVEYSVDPSKYGASFDVIWVGQWVPPLPPGGLNHGIYIPMVRK